MSIRVVGAAAALAVVALAAGCGGGGSSNAGGTTTTTTAAATTTTATASSVKVACNRLNAATQQSVRELGSTLSGFQSVRSLSALARHTTALQTQLRSSTARIAAVNTPPGPLTRDKQNVSAALASLRHKLAAARAAATSGHTGTAAKDFTSLAQLTSLRHAAASLARDCPRG